MTPLEALALVRGWNNLLGDRSTDHDDGRRQTDRPRRAFAKSQRRGGMIRGQNRSRKAARPQR